MTESVTSAAGTYVTVGSHVPIEMAERLASLARENERSVSGELRLALRRHLAAVCDQNQLPVTAGH